jgi:hypothetical protein
VFALQAVFEGMDHERLERAEGLETVVILGCRDASIAQAPACSRVICSIIEVVPVHRSRV